MQERPDPSPSVDEVAELAVRLRQGGASLLRELVEERDGLSCCAPLWIAGSELDRNLELLPDAERERLERNVARHARPVVAPEVQRRELEFGWLESVARPHPRLGVLAGPRPAQLLPTLVRARSAGVGERVVAARAASQSLLAAAGAAGASGVLLASGLPAAIALRLGIAPAPRCDHVLVPEELVDPFEEAFAAPELAVLVDRTTDPRRVDAELAAWHESRPHAECIVVTAGDGPAIRVERSYASREACADLDAAWARIRELGPERVVVLAHPAASPEARFERALLTITGPAASAALVETHVPSTRDLGACVSEFSRTCTHVHVDDAVTFTSEVEELARLDRRHALARLAYVVRLTSSNSKNTR